jgi:hypothetical protein
MFTRAFLRTALCGVALPFAFAAPAFALTPTTYVSITGNDVGNCATPGAACRTFNYAIGQTSAGGEVKAMSAGSFGPFTVNKAITITGVEGAGVVQTANADAITISAGANDAISLVGLSIDGYNSAAPNGVKVTSAGSVKIKNCLVRNFFGSGISFTSSGATKFMIEDTSLSDFGWAGVSVMASPGGSATGGLVRVVVSGAKWAGVEVGWSNHVSIADSIAVNNESGFMASSSSKLILARSSATENKWGVARVGAAAIIESAGNNSIRDNVTNVQGAMSVVGQQ